MKGLLDTHAFLWWDGEPNKLSAPARAFIQDPANTIFLSLASVWEIIIKSALGKLTLQLPLHTILAQQQANGIQLLPVSLDHLLALQSLPAIHKDPFDRILVAQANTESALLISNDPALKNYPVNVLW